MPACVALLRGVNMGGNKKLAMSDLKALAARLGLADPRTLLQSGNLVFSSGITPSALEALLEKELVKRLALTTTAFVRTSAEWGKLVAGNPFSDEAARDPSHLALFVMKDKAPPRAVSELRSCITGREYFEARGREMYAFFPDGFAKTKFTTALIDRILGTIITARNWSTVLKIAAALQA